MWPQLRTWGVRSSRRTGCSQRPWSPSGWPCRQHCWLRGYYWIGMLVTKMPSGAWLASASDRVCKNDHDKRQPTNQSTIQPTTQRTTDRVQPTWYFLSKCIIILFVTTPCCETRLKKKCEKYFGKCVFNPFHQLGWSLTPHRKKVSSSRNGKQDGNTSKVTFKTLANHCRGGWQNTTPHIHVATIRKAAPPVLLLATCPPPPVTIRRSRQYKSAKNQVAQPRRNQGLQKNLLSEQSLH